MESAPSRFVLHVGVDIAAKKASVAWIKPPELGKAPFEIPLTLVGMADLEKRLLTVCAQPNAVHIIMEATGNYHHRLAHFLHDQGFALSVVNPVQARRFAEVFLKREKTDALDAISLAEMGVQVALKLWSPPPALCEELQQRIVQRAALVKVHAETVNKQKMREYRVMALEPVDARAKELMLLLKRQIKQIEKEFEVILKQDPVWAATAKRITTIPGVGVTTAVWLIMLTRNFTACDSADQLASFVGLVPHQRQSGTSLNTYTSIGHVGHDDIRQHLYIATMSCLRYNPFIRAYYDQVKARRKVHRLACVAATRKLIHLIWAVAKSDKPFDLDFAMSKIKAATPEPK